MTRREDQRRSTAGLRGVDGVDGAGGPKKPVREWWDFLGHIDDLICCTDKNVSGSDDENQPPLHVESASFLEAEEQVSSNSQ